MSESPNQIIFSASEAVVLCHKWREAHLTISLTNGCFDVLHVGHLRGLVYAKQQADRLIVAVNDDSSVQRLKGPGRPMFALPLRMEMLSGLRCVDAVVAFSESTAEQIVSILKPDMYVKGGDYDPSSLPEAKIVAAYGGRVIMAPFYEGFSTTKTVDAQLLSRDLS